MQFEDYQKYRWFITSKNNLVIGGKSAEQNESLIKNIKKQKNNFTILHTAFPGSPFTVILTNNSPSNDEIQQASIFTASFSRQWKNKKKTAEVHIFKLSQIYKTNTMKIGTFGVNPPIKKIKVSLNLALTKQKNKLRAVPLKTTKLILLKISPGNLNKEKATIKIKEILNNKFTKEEILQALPTGGFSIK